METEEDPSSFLATTAQLQEDLEISTGDHDAAQAVAAGLRDAKAANTRRAYGRGWAAFTAWADAHGYQYMPAAPQTVALYLGHLEVWPESHLPGFVLRKTDVFQSDMT